MIRLLFLVERRLRRSRLLESDIEFYYHCPNLDSLPSISMELRTGGQPVPYASVSVCCETGNLFKSYRMGASEQWLTTERLYFRGVGDAVDYLLFALRQSAPHGDRNERSKPVRPTTDLASKTLL
jgi:hypothetical protein